jgi:ubiquinone/menaquinone biosynthesis C-methylase UbiE
MPLSIDELYGELWGKSPPGLAADVRRSLHPRSADSLYDAFAACEVRPGDLVLDLGSRDAGHAIELAKRFGCRCVAIDPVALHREQMRKAIDAAGAGSQVTAMQAAIEALPFAGESADALWCRDVLNHVELPRGFAECARVLKPGRFMLIYVTLATERCEPREAARLFEALAILRGNMHPDYFEACARAAGLVIDLVDRIDSEWREHAIESGDRWEELKALLQIARMRRQEEELVQRYGRKQYEGALAGELWGIYQLLGKLCPTVYRLRKS